jgi:hypothetical protein
MELPVWGLRRECCGAWLPGEYQGTRLDVQRRQAQGRERPLTRIY